MIPEEKLDSKIGSLLETLYSKRFDRLRDIKLRTLMEKNPYLYRAIGINDPSEFIEQLLAARISSSDETILGNDFFEPLALWSAKEADQHQDGERHVTVGAGAGQDIAIETANAYRAISVKSGKNIFNSQSQKAQSTEFDELQARLKKLNKQFLPIIGYGYGRKTSRSKKGPEKIAGQVFWELLTGEQDYYLRIEKSIGKFAHEHGEAYKDARATKKAEILRSFMLNFVAEDGRIKWDEIVRFNSGKDRPGRLITHVPGETKDR